MERRTSIYYSSITLRRSFCSNELHELKKTMKCMPTSINCFTLSIAWLALALHLLFWGEAQLNKEGSEGSAAVWNITFTFLELYQLGSLFDKNLHGMKVLAMYKQMSTIDGAFTIQEIQRIYRLDGVLLMKGLQSTSQWWSSKIILM